MFNSNVVRTYHKPRRIFSLPILRWEVFSSSLLSSRSSHRHPIQPFIRPAYESHGGGFLSRGTSDNQQLVPPRNAERRLPVLLRSQQQYLTKSLEKTKIWFNHHPFLAIQPDNQEESNQVCLRNLRGLQLHSRLVFIAFNCTIVWKHCVHLKWMN